MVETHVLGADSIGVFADWWRGTELLGPRDTCIAGHLRFLFHATTLSPRKQKEVKQDDVATNNKPIYNIYNETKPLPRSA